jgi:Collagen triple helix repeat (20 copies)
MKIYSYRSSALIILCGAALALTGLACSSGTTGTGTGGSGGNSKGGNGGAGTAGTAGGSGGAGAGGSSGSSGGAGSGGNAGSAGNAGSSGNAGSAGNAGTSGNAGASGNAGSAGNAGSSGNAGSAGNPDAAAAGLSFTFDSSVDGFVLQTYVDTGSYTDLGALAADAGVPDGGSYPTLTFNSTAGSPSPGSLQVTADFTNYNQYVEILLGLSPPRNLAGLTLTALVQVTSSFNGGAFLYAKTGPTYVYGSATGVALTAGTWVPLTLDLSTTTAASGDTAFDPTMVEEIGLHIYSAGTPADGGTFAGGTSTFLVDQVVTQ